MNFCIVSKEADGFVWGLERYRSHYEQTQKSPIPK